MGSRMSSSRLGQSRIGSAKRNDKTSRLNQDFPSVMISAIAEDEPAEEYGLSLQPDNQRSHRISSSLSTGMAGRRSSMRVCLTPSLTHQSQCFLPSYMFI